MATKKIIESTTCCCCVLIVTLLLTTTEVKIKGVETLRARPTALSYGQDKVQTTNANGDESRSGKKILLGFFLSAGSIPASATFTNNAYCRLEVCVVTKLQDIFGGTKMASTTNKLAFEKLSLTEAGRNACSELVKLAQHFAKLKMPYSAQFGGDESLDWSDVAQALKRRLNLRKFDRLTDVQATLLSLSRSGGRGPKPLLSKNDADVLMLICWPRRYVSSTVCYDWSRLAEVLDSVVEMSDEEIKTRLQKIADEFYE
jgi:hypothetical protein